jgi:hypothetical protein
MRNSGMIKQQRQIEKLKPWLNKIRIMYKFNSLQKTKEANNIDEDGQGLDDSDEEMKSDELKKVKVLKII